MRREVSKPQKQVLQAIIRYDLITSSVFIPTLAKLLPYTLQSIQIECKGRFCIIEQEKELRPSLPLINTQ